MTFALRGDALWLHGLAALALIATTTPQTMLLAQGLDDPQAVDTIIGSDVEVDQAGTRQAADAVIAAIENTAASIEEVRKTFTLDKVEIVLLPDIDQPDSPVAQKIEQHSEEIDELRQTIEGNPMFYHAADSHSVLVGDIVALEFDDANGVKIYAAGKAPAE
jgi:hypothetical protein